MFVPVRVCLCVCLYMFVYVCLCMFVYACLFMHVCLFVCFPCLYSLFVAVGGCVFFFCMLCLWLVELVLVFDFVLSGSIWLHIDVV